MEKKNKLIERNDESIICDFLEDMQIGNISDYKFMFLADPNGLFMNEFYKEVKKQS